jgi:hypothetical protein
LNLGVTWEHEPELGFVPPRCLWEYLSGYPNGIREAVGEAVKSLEVSLSDDDLDDLAQDIVAMFLVRAGEKLDQEAPRERRSLAE